MNPKDEHVHELLPFYINRTLSAGEKGSVEAHLKSCPECQTALREWKVLSTAFLYPRKNLPPLSPVVRANLRPRPSFAEAVHAAAALIGMQRIYLREGWLIPSTTTVLLAGILTALLLSIAGDLWALAPVFILVPLVTILATSFLVTSIDDPALEIVTATPTQPGILIYARLTLGLVAVISLAMFGSLIIAGIGGLPLAWFIAAWLGPLLMLSAFTTLLALLLNPWAAAGVSTSLWGSIVLLIFAEKAGAPLVGFSLAPLLHPNGLVFGGQVLLAIVLWLTSWLWLTTGAPTSLQIERGR